MKTLMFAIRLVVAAVLSGCWAGAAYALPGPGGGVNPVDPRVPDCLRRTAASLTATPSTINQGSSVTLRWSANIPLDCQTLLRHLTLNGSSVGANGVQSVQPLATTDFALKVETGNQGGPATLALTTVTVQLPPVVHIKGSSSDWQALLLQALSQPNTTIYLASNVDMDLSYLESIWVANGVSVIGGEPCDRTTTSVVAANASRASLASANSTPAVAARFASNQILATAVCGGRTAQAPGPRLFTTTRPNPLFETRCDAGLNGGNIRFEGFRIQGPDWTPVDGERERGILVNSCTGVDIGNMELSGWAGAAVRVTDTASLLTRPDAVKVHDSFIHHNQHTGGEGYGVDVSSGGWALIERNVFDFNRHAVTHGYVVGSEGRGGYEADNNLILKGGGYNGNDIVMNVQQFDVHGDDNCGPGAIFNKSLWNCGRSGQDYRINFNAFQYTTDHSFLLRGTPTVGAFLYDNVFPKAGTDAVDTAGNGTTGLFNTTQFAPLDTFGHYQVCDFDGNGHDGLFLATGVTWWYMSSAKRQWTYLSGSDLDDAPDQLVVGDFEGTGRCDVFRVHDGEWWLSRGGREPWQSLGTFGVPLDQLRFGDFTGSGRTEIFRRDPTGQWWIISAGLFGWTQLGSSTLPLSQLHFGDFNGHGVTDVVANVNGHWSVSWGGRTSWQPLNTSLSDSLDTTFIADLDGKGTDDILRYNSSSRMWEVSVGGRTTWQQLAHQDPVDMGGGAYVGHFDGSRGAQLLTIGAPNSDQSAAESARRGLLFSRSTGSFVPYGMYAY